MVSPRDGAGSLPSVLISERPLGARQLVGVPETESSRKSSDATCRTLDRTGGRVGCRCSYGIVDGSCVGGSDAWKRSSKSHRISSSYRNSCSSHGGSYFASMRTSWYLGVLGKRAFKTLFCGYSGNRQRCSICGSTAPTEPSHILGEVHFLLFHWVDLLGDVIPLPIDSSGSHRSLRSAFVVFPVRVAPRHGATAAVARIARQPFLFGPRPNRAVRRAIHSGISTVEPRGANDTRANSSVMSAIALITTIWIIQPSVVTSSAQSDLTLSLSTSSLCSFPLAVCM